MAPSETGSPQRGALVVFDRGMYPDAAAAHAIVDLLGLVDDEAHVDLFGLTLHLQFNGFGPRRPETVHEVRRFLSTMHAQWPWWIHFLAPEPAQWRTLLLGLTPMRRSPVGWTTDMAALRRCVRELLHTDRVLHSHLHRIPVANRVVTRQSWKAIKAAFS